MAAWAPHHGVLELDSDSSNLEPSQRPAYLSHPDIHHAAAVAQNGAPAPVSASLKLPSISFLTSASTETFTHVANHLAPPFGRQPPLFQHQQRDQLASPRSEAGMPRGRPSSATRASPRTPPKSNMGSQLSKSTTSRSTARQTPSKPDLTVDQLQGELEALSKDVGRKHQELCIYLLKSAKAPKNQISTGTDWFASMKSKPVSEENDRTLRAKFKQHLRGKRDQRELHFEVIGIKSKTKRVPAYRFHHIEVTKNILTPDTMLKFVPHIRDLEPHQEHEYNRWLSELEDMDGQCGFKTLTQEQKAAKIIKDECVAQVSLFLESWLKKLAIPGLTLANLIRYLTNQEPDDSITPQQKSSILEFADEKYSGSLHAGQAARMFTEAFDNAFKGWAKDQDVTLRNVLLDPTVDEMVYSKKTAKDVSALQKPSEDPLKDVDAHLETYAVFGCLICFSHSCEHGEYDEVNKHERMSFSVESQGRISGLLRRRRELASYLQPQRDDNSEPSPELSPEPCKRSCFRINGGERPENHPEPDLWAEEELRIFKTLILTSHGSRVKMWPQCSTAELLDRPCWDVQRQFMAHKLNLLTSPQREHVPLPKVKSVPWYDRYEKCLMGEWQDITDTHNFQRRCIDEPCRHSGPCSAANNCPCFEAKVMCERFCSCTAEICPIKFTGCACRSTGKSCFAKQKDKPCICVQLNRECDPVLCGTCGATERADPENARCDALFATGCQNVSLQRGVGKSVLVGESQLPGVGYGLFAAEDIGRDEFVIEYVGELISHDEGVRREARRGADLFDSTNNSSYLFTLLEYEGIWVDAAIYGNMSRYINHCASEKRSCNVTPKILYVNGEYRIQFTALRDIKTGEELFFDYGENFPNLTQKLLDDKENQGAANGAAVAPESAAKPHGRRRGEREKVVAQKATKPKKQFAPAKAYKPSGARKEAPVATPTDAEAHFTAASFALEEDTATTENFVPEPEVLERVFKSRKRTRPEEGTDEEEYNPGKLDSQDTDDAEGSRAMSSRTGSGRRRKMSKMALEARKQRKIIAAIDQEFAEAQQQVDEGRAADAADEDDISVDGGGTALAHNQPAQAPPVTPSPAKRRGRKPRAKMVKSPEPEEETPTAAHEELDPGEITDPTPTRRRGRPPGRPRKSKTAVIPDSDSEGPDSQLQMESRTRPKSQSQAKSPPQPRSQPQRQPAQRYQEQEQPQPTSASRRTDPGSRGRSSHRKAAIPDDSDLDGEYVETDAMEVDEQEDEGAYAVRRSGRKRRATANYRGIGRPDMD